VSTAELDIEIVYAEPHRVIAKSFRLAEGSRVADAVRLAALDPDFSALDLANSPLGIFGKLARAEQTLRDGDRLEIYRPLAADPKVARRARAARAGVNKSGRS
jgi:uncharacterized protein